MKKSSQLSSCWDQERSIYPYSSSEERTLLSKFNSSIEGTFFGIQDAFLCEGLFGTDRYSEVNFDKVRGYGLVFKAIW